MNRNRRAVLKAAAGAAVAIPLLTIGMPALAAKNAGLRTALKYQDVPSGTKRCDNCLHWKPGRTPRDRGGCNIMPGDTEIAPAGYCVGWVAAKK
jgi:hypothetical protein